MGSGIYFEKREVNEYTHLIVEKLHLIHNIETAMHDEGIQPAGFLAESGNAIAALLRGAKFKFE